MQEVWLLKLPLLTEGKSNMGQATKGGNYKGKQHQYLGKGSVSELPNCQRGGNLLKERREETARKQE